MAVSKFLIGFSDLCSLPVASQIRCQVSYHHIILLNLLWTTKKPGNISKRLVGRQLVLGKYNIIFIFHNLYVKKIIVQKFDVFMKYEIRLGHTDATNQTKQEMNLDTASIIWVELGTFSPIEKLLFSYRISKRSFQRIRSFRFLLKFLCYPSRCLDDILPQIASWKVRRSGLNLF